MSYETNPYYQPEATGLKIIGTVEDPEACWTFKTLVVWTDGKRLLWATDSGCSCPTPFDDVEPIPATKPEIYRAIDAWVDSVSEYRDHQTRVEAQRDALILKAKVREWRRGVSHA